MAQAWDISMYFDRKVLIDVLDVASEAKIDDKCYRLLYKLNENTKVQVQTPAGLSDVACTGENLGQGSKSAGMLSALDLDSGIASSYTL